MSSDHKPIESHVLINGLELVLYEWPGTEPQNSEPPILFLHASGFHAHLWNQVIDALSGRHCLALDLRGHGRSSKPEPPDAYEWRAFAEDIVGLIEQRALTGAIGVGHSLGGHALAQAEALTPGHFAALLLIDPVILPKAVYAVERSNEPSEPHFTARRRADWGSSDEMFARFKDRPPYNRWQAAVLRDYCEYGLLPKADGIGFTLACPPRIEAAIYPNAVHADIYDLLSEIEIPVRILRAAQQSESNPGADFSGSATAPDLVSYFRQGEDIPLADLSHFIPMEAPDLVAHHVSALIERATLN